MAENSGPWDGSPGTFSEDQWSKMFDGLLPNGVLNAQPSDNDLLPYGDSSGMHVKVRVGQAFLGGQWYENTAEKSVNIDNGDAQPRIDFVVLRRNASTNTITATVQKGTAQASPVAPSIDPVNDLPLAVVAVSANLNTSIAAGAVTDKRKLAARFGRAAQTALELPSDVKAGDLLMLAGAEYAYDGTAWHQLQTVDDTGWVNLSYAANFAQYSGGGWDSYPTPAARRLNGVVYLRGFIARTSTGAVRTDYPVATLPSGTFPPFIHRWASTPSWATDTIDLYVGATGSLHVISGATGLVSGSGFPIDTSFTVS